MAEFHYDKNEYVKAVQNSIGLLGHFAYNQNGKRYVLEFDGETPVSCVRLTDGKRRSVGKRDRISAWEGLIADDVMLRDFMTDIKRLNENGPFYEFIGDQPLSRPADEYQTEPAIFVGTGDDVRELKPAEVSTLLFKLKAGGTGELRKFIKKDPEY
ncbi:MAG: hypothetical protein NTU57_02980 [Candidatus Aenigmarchaeota archaeon]|nr:hypothetical protein [Candidatus Aenigmarchaeota archaeon]